MADDTNKTAATDDALDKAAADAVASQEEVVEEVVEETKVEAAPEPEAEQLDEGLPTDHKARTRLGKTVAAMHRRQDTSDERIERMIDMMERQMESSKPKPEDPLENMDANEPLTAGELREILTKREEARETRDSEKRSAETRVQTAYDSEYLTSFQGLATDLPEDEYNGILEEMKTLSYNPTANGGMDAELNFYKAERAYLRKKVAQPLKKEVPLRGDKVPGVVTNNKVTEKVGSLPKLDAAGESYLAFVRAEDGAEAAEKVHRASGEK